eukprot:TRINITY_DN30212_c0_g1_i1.p1 TRINITY_DN30212_c0_g1~~TRINITY_DN30212_c0_g1_i1.p1  ORF type:complete len:172 (-),score=21.01 TRINITY_DN30212_c0_g1_i1:310-825(-)
MCKTRFCHVSSLHQGALETLYSPEFYTLCKSRMHEKSVLVTQSGHCNDVRPSGIEECPELQADILANIAKVFGSVQVLQHPMATWKIDESTPSVWSSLVLATEFPSDDPAISPGRMGFAETERLLQAQVAPNALTYYSMEVHEAAQAKPHDISVSLASLIDGARQPGRSDL